MKKVTGVGGIFFKCDDPKKMQQWYVQNLGLNGTDYGVSFEWRDLDDPSKECTTAWATFPKETKNFDPSKKDFMINYRVENMEELVEQLKSDGVTIVDEVKVYEGYGKFVHIMDPEGNKIELWEPSE